MKNAFKTTGTILLFIFIALCFGLTASNSGYQITLYNFLAGNGHNLPPDFAMNVKTSHQVASVLYIIFFFAIAFFSGKKNLKNVYRGMIIYSSLPFVGLIGYFFLKKSMKAGIIILMTLIWGYPYFPLIINESSVSSIITPMGISMVLSLIGLIALHFAGKKFQ